MRDLPAADVETLERAAEILERMLEGERGLSAALRRSFNSLEVPNYRRYFAGQLISLSGTWMQTVAAIWLILSLTGSGVAVGLTTALQFLPMLLFGAWGGLLADRFPKRRLLIATQALMAIPAARPLRGHRDRRRRALDGLPRGLRDGHRSTRSTTRPGRAS